MEEIPGTPSRPPPGPPAGRFVMVCQPEGGYAGRIGDDVVVTEITRDCVYVEFASGMRDCYPPHTFARLFRRH